MNHETCLVFLATLCVLPMASLDAQSKDKKNDPDQIGNRDVGKGVNFYSLEKEIALGKADGSGDRAPGEVRGGPGSGRIRQPTRSKSRSEF